ncbi:DNA recombination protein RmuC [Henriciella barbarensis]|uniref:DNA recombination protein RmuC homolog n=1 Tax=Henriciella barbarensis TaxID=86342 RepID=A0A399QWL9_9PROT|nr:DNA recombination protein RmuC [Henriciella barbarensis]RIJ23466.1 DNA recombination protein RmuC [Henriciella barbarensis]
MEALVTIGTVGLDLIHLVLLLAALGLAAALYAVRSKLTARNAEIARDLEHAEDALADTKAERDDLRQQLKTKEAVALEAEKSLARAEARSEEDEKKFADLAQRVLDQSSRRFLTQADEHFKRHKEGAQTNLKELMTPINKNLEDFAKKVSELEKVRADDKSVLQEQVKAIGESLKVHTSETNKLVSALSAPRGGGRWGETTLRNVMEHAGLSAHCDFSEQVHGETESGRQRPDVIIKLPGGREIVVDSKVTLEDYLKAIDETDPARREAYMRAHGRKVRDHIKTLGSKDYQSAFSQRVDFVALFIPGESFYVAALEFEPDLFDFAAARQVIVVTPSTLLALAKAVAYGWRQEQATENAKKAAELGRELYSRLTTLGSHVEKMGKSLNSAVDTYNKMGSSLTSRVLPAARKFEDLQIAPPEKSVPEIESIEKRATLPDRTGELEFDNSEE